MADPSTKPACDLEPDRAPHPSAAGISVRGVLHLASETNLAIVADWHGRCVALGFVIRALASGQVKKDRELTTTGPYAYVRNPLYLGSILHGIGFAIAARDPWIGVVLVLYFVLVYVPVIRARTSLSAQPILRLCRIHAECAEPGAAHALVQGSDDLVSRVSYTFVIASTMPC